MAQKVTERIELVTPELNDIIPVVDVSAGPDGSKKMTIDTLKNKVNVDVTNDVVNSAIEEDSEATRTSLGLTAESHSLVVSSLVIDHQSSNTKLTNNSLNGWARCLTELETGGILDVLVDGWCGRVGYNSPDGHKTILNASATIRGSVETGSDGAIFFANPANSLQFTVPDTRVFSLATDFRFAEDAGTNEVPIGLTNASGTNICGSVLLAASAKADSGTIFSANGGSAAYTDVIGNNDSAINVHRYNPTDTIACWATDNTADPEIKSWVNGKLRMTDSTGSEQATSEMTEIHVGCYDAGGGTSYTAGMSGTVASWLLFSRVLTDGENLTVAQALRHLDPREINIVTYGDSRTCQQTIAGSITKNWPLKYWKSPDLAKTARLCNIANNGWDSEVLDSDFESRAGHLGVNGTSIKESRFIFWVGANDWNTGETAVDTWAFTSSILTKARNIGMRLTLCTDPEAGSDYDAAEEIERAAFNAFIQSSPQSYDALWDINSLLEVPRNTAIWFDQTHLNDTGNEWLAANLASGGYLSLPNKETTVVLDQDITRVSTDTATDIDLAGSTKEGLSVLGLSLAANEMVAFELVLLTEYFDTDFNTKVEMNLPSGASVLMQSCSTASASAGVYHWGGPLVLNLLPSSSNDSIQRITGVIQNGATEGNAVVQVAQFTPSATTLTIKEGSTLKFFR